MINFNNLELVVQQVVAVVMVERNNLVLVVERSAVDNYIVGLAAEHNNRWVVFVELLAADNYIEMLVLVVVDN